MIREKSCGAVVYKTEGNERFYLIEHMAVGHLSLPKGHVENSETEAETALREIKEETNLDVELDTSFREVISYSPYHDCVKDVVFFVAKAKAGPLVNQESEVSLLEWKSFEERHPSHPHSCTPHLWCSPHLRSKFRVPGRGQSIRHA